MSLPNKTSTDFIVEEVNLLITTQPSDTQINDLFYPQPELVILDDWVSRI